MVLIKNGTREKQFVYDIASLRLLVEKCLS